MALSRMSGSVCGESGLANRYLLVSVLHSVFSLQRIASDIKSLLSFSLQLTAFDMKSPLSLSFIHYIE